MTAPSAVEVKTWSKVDFSSLGFDDTQLAVLVTRAVDYVADMTGRPLDATMPAGFTTAAQEAVQHRTEQLAMLSQQESLETSTDGLASFSAGSYSETRVGSDAFRKSGLVNPNPLLHDLLWRLMTPEKRDEALVMLNPDQPIPDFEVTEIDWDGAYTFNGYSWGA